MKAGINRRQFMQKSLVGAAAAPLVPTCWATRRRPSPRPSSPNDRIQVGHHRRGRARPVGRPRRRGRGAGRRGDRRLRRLQGPRDARPRAPRRQGEGLRRLPRAPRRQVDRRRHHRDPRPLAQASRRSTALAAGKDVYLEKPMTLTIDEGPEMYAAAEKSGRILQIGSNGMSSKLQQTAREIIKSGKLGADQPRPRELRPQHRLRRLALPHPARRRPEDGELGHVPRARPRSGRSASSASSAGAASGTTRAASRPTSSST